MSSPPAVIDEAAVVALRPAASSPPHFHVRVAFRPAEDATPFMQDDAMASLEWSRRWPCEEIWKARKTNA